MTEKKASSYVIRASDNGNYLDVRKDDRTILSVHATIFPGNCGAELLSHLYMGSTRKDELNKAMYMIENRYAPYTMILYTVRSDNEPIIKLLKSRGFIEAYKVPGKYANNYYNNNKYHMILYVKDPRTSKLDETDVLVEEKPKKKVVKKTKKQVRK